MSLHLSTYIHVPPSDVSAVESFANNGRCLFARPTGSRDAAMLSRATDIFRNRLKVVTRLAVAPSATSHFAEPYYRSLRFRVSIVIPVGKGTLPAFSSVSQDALMLTPAEKWSRLVCRSVWRVIMKFFWITCLARNKNNASNVMVWW